MRSRILIIVLALALGGAAAVLAANYLRSARTDISAQSEPVEVLVAQENLPRGLSAEELISRKLVKIERVPRRFVAGDAVSSARAIEGQVLAVPLSAGEQLTKTRFQYPEQAGLSYSVPEGFVAVSVGVDDVTGVAGLLKPGDNVMVFTTFEPEGGKSKSFTMTTVGKAKVLAVADLVSAEQAAANEADAQNTKSGGLASNRSATAQATYRNVTLALSPEDAERLVYSREIGSVQLALMAQNAPEPTKPAPVTLDSPNYGSFHGIVK